MKSARYTFLCFNRFLKRSIGEKIHIVTSVITLSEVLIHPLRQGDEALATQYSRILLNAAHVQALAVSPLIASAAARLRASHGYKMPDAIQIATAQSAHATFFVTNDEALAGISGLRVIVLKQLLTLP